jgi:hypothetical protein
MKRFLGAILTTLTIFVLLPEKALSKEFLGATARKVNLATPYPLVKQGYVKTYSDWQQFGRFDIVCVSISATIEYVIRKNDNGVRDFRRKTCGFANFIQVYEVGYAIKRDFLGRAIKIYVYTTSNGDIVYTGDFIE